MATRRRRPARCSRTPASRCAAPRFFREVFRARADARASFRDIALVEPPRIFVQPLIGGAPDQSPVMWPTKHVWKTCQEQFPYTAPIRHDLPRPFFAFGKPFQPLLATCRKTSDFRHRRQRLIQTGSKTQPIVFLGKQKLTRSSFVCLCVSAVFGGYPRGLILQLAAPSPDGCLRQI